MTVIMAQSVEVRCFKKYMYGVPQSGRWEGEKRERERKREGGGRECVYVRE